MQLTKQDAIRYINEQKENNLAYIKVGLMVGSDKDFLKEVVESDFLSHNDICDREIEREFYEEISELRANALQDCLDLLG
jgi:hypothetical protein